MASPESPFSPAETMGLEFKSVYDANIAAGFTPPQALYLLAVQMVGNPGIAPGVDLPDPPQGPMKLDPPEYDHPK